MVRARNASLLTAECVVQDNVLNALLVDTVGVGTPSDQASADEWDRFDLAHFCVELDAATSCIRVAPPASSASEGVALVSAPAEGDSDDESRLSRAPPATPPFDPWGGRVFIGASLGASQ